MLSKKKRIDRFAWTKGIKGAIGAPEQPKKRMDYSSYTQEDKDMPEAEIQAKAEELCQQLGIYVVRIPDQILGFLAQRAPAPIKYFVKKYLRGFPDLLMIHNNNFLFLEIKTVKRKGEKNGGLEASQIKWWANYGEKPNLAYGWEETSKKIIDFHQKTC